MCLVCNVELTEVKYNSFQPSSKSGFWQLRAAVDACVVCGRHSVKQHHICCFSQGSAATLFKWRKQVYKFLMWNLFEFYVHQKLLKSVHPSPSNSKYKRGRFLRHSVWLMGLQHTMDRHVVLMWPYIIPQWQAMTAVVLRSGESGRSVVTSTELN